ncbi:hypothetical protein DUI87_31219 [Hirundo rustica rustica]|uniref:Uncharacterized protein n=1 Tax=Hirundo rustica rustica TaxID=333673 RepID=A0A3M0IUK5_HIRRU|nr:hypothetical protein DUI87_31219 [Hirundo rustica rustica]
MKASKVFFTSELFYFVLRVNISVSPESSGEEPMNKAAAEGALPGAMSYRNSCQEPKELGDSPDFFRDVSNDLTLIVNLKAALRGIKLPAYATLIG